MIRLIYHIGFSLNILLPLLCAAWVLWKGKNKKLNWTWAQLCFWVIETVKHTGYRRPANN